MQAEIENLTIEERRLDEQIRFGCLPLLILCCIIAVFACCLLRAYFYFFIIAGRCKKDYGISVKMKIMRSNIYFSLTHIWVILPYFYVHNFI